MRRRGESLLYLKNRLFSCFRLYVCKSSSVCSLWLAAVLHLAVVIAVLLITWGISINLFDVQEKARNILGELISTYYILNPELPLFIHFYVPHLNKTVSILLFEGLIMQIRSNLNSKQVNSVMAVMTLHKKLTACLTIFLQHQKCFSICIFSHNYTYTSAQVQPLKSLSTRPFRFTYQERSS